MREILFRGQSKKTKEWVYGYLYQTSTAAYICLEMEGNHPHMVEVIPKTVGRYTEFKDKNKTKIFEGDCLGHKLNNVEMLNGEWCVAGDRPLSMFLGSEIVGNIYENKNSENYYDPKMELLERLIHVLYKLPDCNCGGICHVITDDDNITDEVIKYVLEFAKEKNNESRIEKGLCELICNTMLELSYEKRAVTFFLMNKGDDVNKTTVNEAVSRFGIKNIIDDIECNYED